MGARVRTLYRWPGKRERSEAEDFFCTRTTVLHCAQVVGCVAKAAARVAGRNPAGGPARSSACSWQESRRRPGSQQRVWLASLPQAARLAAARVAGRNPAGGPAPGPLASRPHTCRAIKALIFAGSGAMVQEAPLVESI